MAICPTDATTYQEEIETFVIRGIDGITIPKIVRQEAYTLAVDIIIRSIARETYVNYECMPPESYYGVATLVMQDALELKIPVKFPRQRIYYGRVPEAFGQWNDLVNFEYTRQYFISVGESIASLGAALGLTPIPIYDCCSLPQPSWVELPLREVYFHPPIGTQYEIEVSWIHPVAFSDECDTFYEGFSRQVDGDKDDGLPPNGIFPNIAGDADDPYAGLPGETPDSEQLGFSNSKSANLGDIDPDSLAQIDRPATEAEEGYFWQITWVTSLSETECTPKTVNLAVAAPPTTNYRQVSITSASHPCGGASIVQWKITNASDESTFFDRGGSYCVLASVVSAALVYDVLPRPSGGIALTDYP